MRVVKRLIDVVLGALLALASIPVILVLAVIVAVHLRQWPFFIQERIGQYGRHFRFPKLRTMPKEAPKYAVKGDAALTKVQIPRFLQFMRTAHLDELPQLFLVPAGVMSLVGPRPKMPDAFEEADGAYTEARVQVPQGCTGLWQVGAHTDMLPSQAPEYDYYYLTNWSLSLDMWIMWRTFLKMIRVGRPVSLDELPAFLTRSPVDVGPVPVLHLVEAKVVDVDDTPTAAEAAV